MLTRVVPLDRLPIAMGQTARDILKVIALHLGEEEEKYVPYMLIALSINKSRETVSSSINRMLKAKVLKEQNGKLSIPCSILVNVQEKEKLKCQQQH